MKEIFGIFRIFMMKKKTEKKKKTKRFPMNNILYYGRIFVESLIKLCPNIIYDERNKRGSG